MPRRPCVLTQRGEGKDKSQNAILETNTDVNKLLSERALRFRLRTLAGMLASIM
jgi:hypothetical protein